MDFAFNEEERQILDQLRTAIRDGTTFDGRPIQGAFWAEDEIYPGLHFEVLRSEVGDYLGSLIDRPPTRPPVYVPRTRSSHFADTRLPSTFGYERRGESGLRALAPKLPPSPLTNSAAGLFPPLGERDTRNVIDRRTGGDPGPLMLPLLPRRSGSGLFQ